MGVLTGERAAIEGITCLRKFQIISEGKPGELVCSSSKGAQILIPGNEKWGGVALAYGHTPAKMPGAEFDLNLALSNGKGATAPVLATDIEVHWDVEEAGALYHFLYFKGNGPLVREDNPAVDNGTPSPVSAVELGVKIDSDPYAIRKAMMKISRPATPYNDTSTGKHTGWKPGYWVGGFDLLAYFDDFSDAPLANTLIELLFQTVKDSNTGWNMKYPYVEKSEELVDVEGPGDGRAELCAVQIAGRWSGFEGSTIGQLVTPGGVTIWPET